MTFDKDRYRHETPGVHNRIHFNNAGAALMPLPVYMAVKDHMDLELNIGGYEAQDRARPAFERTYDAIAELINCDRSEIALVENATVAWQMAFYGLPLEKGDRILTAEAEYAANVIAFLQLKQRKGITVDFIPSDANGQVDTDALETMIDDRVKLISITHIPTNGGLINPAEKIGQIAKKHGIPYLLDACQAVGQIPVDVEKIGCDMLSATGRKYLRGPRGTGFLYVRKGFMEKMDPPFLDMHGAEWTEIDRFEVRPDARRFENWEFNTSAVLGLGAAVDYLLEIGIDPVSARLRYLADSLRTELSAVAGIGVHDIGSEKGGLVTFRHMDKSANAVKSYLADNKINTSVTTTSSTRFDLEKRNIDELVRSSVHYYNNENEIDKFVEILKKI